MRRMLVVACSLVLLLAAAPATATPQADKGNADSDHKVVVCHRTEASQTGAEASAAHDADGGWVLISVSAKAWEVHQGHQDHESTKWDFTDVLYDADGHPYCAGDEEPPVEL